jgi:NAD(P)-dependent dehydrogenase (short-subunit alcohol dehydrogenase family)
MDRTALVQGASRGLGLELVRQLAVTHDRVIATCRRPADAHALAALAASNPAVAVLRLDATDEASIAQATEEAAALVPHLDLAINAAGLLHAADQKPERRLRDVGATRLAHSFAVNAIGPIVLARYLEPLLANSERAVFAAISARVGSIGDNRLGGWYSYRASKAALNMLIKTLAIEWARRKPPITCIALHPGTVDTDLSRPFVGNSLRRIFSVELAARQLIAVVAGATPERTGRFLAWNGATIPW